MSFLPWWAGVLALMSVPALSWLLFGQMLAVSGRFTALVDRARGALDGPRSAAAGRPHSDGGTASRDGDALSPEELLAALAEATRAEFGRDVQLSPADVSRAAEVAAPRPSPFPYHHVLFLGGLALGGALSAYFAGRLSPRLALDGARFGALFGSDAGGQAAVLLGGGFLVGLGARMCGGCTSGHGLCGVSRLQPGSLASTASFFGAAVLLSLLLERL